MASIDVLKTRDSLITQHLCPESMAEPLAVFADELLDEAMEPLARKDTLEALIEQWRIERAEIAAQQAQFMADVRKEISDFREENNLRERERDERERQRARDQEERDAKLRGWVIGVVGLGFSATVLVSGLLIAFG
ncbi:MAG: hypothetical protein F4007_12965 [Chloroflexi bacterium]|nr:hypothetical protein [Chloroflexota bacterium]